LVTFCAYPFHLFLWSSTLMRFFLFHLGWIPMCVDPILKFLWSSTLRFSYAFRVYGFILCWFGLFVLNFSFCIIVVCHCLGFQVCLVILFCCAIFNGSTKTSSEFYVKAFHFLLSSNFLLAPSLYWEWQVLSAPPWNLQAYYKMVVHHSSAQEVFLLKALPIV